MKGIGLLLASILLLPLPALAAQVYGTLREGGQPVTRGVPVEIRCAQNKPYTGATEADGSYRVFVPEKGKCTFQVTYQGQRPSIEISSFDQPTKYDFDLVRQPNGTYVLRRR